MTVQSRILIIDDDSNIAVALYTAFVKNGYAVDTAKTASSGLRKISIKNYNVILLDLGLPDISGLNLCKQLRSDNVQTPVIALTGDSTVRSKVNLFEAGVNDYVSKPFSFAELHARVRVYLRPVCQEEVSAVITADVFSLDPINRHVERENKIIPLTRKEYLIMECLMHDAGRPVTRAKLLHKAWSSSDDAWTNTIDVHIKRLRDKVDRPFNQRRISTVHGIGYKLLIENKPVPKK